MATRKPKIIQSQTTQQKPSFQDDELQFYKDKLADCEMDIAAARQKETFTAMANLYTKLENLRQKCDELRIIKEKQKNKGYSDLPDEAILDFISDVISTLPRQHLLPILETVQKTLDTKY